jgi:hypothetical protein
MNQIEEILTSGHYKLVESVLSDDTDLLLLYTAIASMKFSGHRYGAFLDAASTAAKLAVYTTYLEQGRNQRKTGFIHHIETKRIKAIVEEIEDALTQGAELKLLGSREPQYLIGIPHLWLSKFPCGEGYCHKIAGLTRRDEVYLQNFRTEGTPKALSITEAEFLELIAEMHDSCQQDMPEHKRTSLSDAMAEHIKFCLLNSGTVLEIKLLDSDFSVYTLLKSSHSPKSYTSRAEVMIRDTLRFFGIMRLWAYKDTRAFRALESFQVKPENYAKAVAELDDFLATWADRHHDPEGQLQVLQVALGPATHDLNEYG